MPTIKMTSRGQMTLSKEVLKHLGVKPGDRIAVELLPDGSAFLQADRPSKSIDSFIGLLAGKTEKVATIEEIDEATKRGWAGVGQSNMPLSKRRI